MSLLAQTDTTAPKQRLEDISSNAGLILEQLAQESTSLVSAVPSIFEDSFNNSASGPLYFPKDAEGLFAFYLSSPIVDPQLFEHISAFFFRDWATTFTENAEAVDPIEEDTELADALADLRTAPDEAREEGLLVPSRKALRNSEHVLREMHRIWSRRFEVYPMPKGEIAIDAPSGTGRSVIVLCDSQGGALCSVNLNGGHRRAHYSDARMLPDGFLRDAISEMTANVRQ